MYRAVSIYIYIICIYVDIFVNAAILIHKCTELKENGNFRLFAANGKGKLPFSCYKQKRKFVFLGWH
jgi:hypothetical protein